MFEREEEVTIQESSKEVKESNEEVYWSGDGKKTSAFHQFEPELKKEEMDMDILGSPIGSEEFCEKYIQQKINKKLPDLLEKLTHLDNPQASYLILLFCASFCKMVSYIRTVP